MHRFYLADRATKLSKLFDAVKQDEKLREQLAADPVTLAKLHGITFSDEELFMITHIKDVDLPTLIKSMAPVGFWDNNCGCGGGGGGGTANW